MRLLDSQQALHMGSPCLPDGLLSPEARARLQAIDSILPPSIVAGTFELRLDASPRVDFQMCFTSRSGGRAALARFFAAASDDLRGIDGASFPEGSTHAPGGVSPAWRRALHFLRFWSSPGSLLHDTSPAAWLEVDCALEDSTAPEPFAFFSLPPPWEDSTLPFSTMLAATREGFEQLAGGRLDPDLWRRIDTTLRDAPPARLLHAALRPIGDTQVARLILRVPVAEIPEMLRRIGWPHPLAPLAALLSRYASYKLVHTLQLDVCAAGVGSPLGLEVFYRGSPSRDPRWRTALDNLVEDQACTPRRRGQVEDWIDAPAPAASANVVRGLLVKIVYDPGASLRAKAYLPYGVASTA